MKLLHIAIIITAAMAGSAQAQNMIANTNQVVMNTLLTSSETASSSSRPQENKPAVLYRERVPGKPEEGFVPVTPATSSRFTTTTVAVRDYGSVAVLSDNTKNVTCYILDPRGSSENTISCVSNK